MLISVSYDNQDDGAQLATLHEADLVLVGVSRTSKTALCTYLMHHGLKVANVPLVPTSPPPKARPRTEDPSVPSSYVHIQAPMYTTPVHVEPSPVSLWPREPKKPQHPPARRRC